MRLSSPARVARHRQRPWIGLLLVGWLASSAASPGAYAKGTGAAEEAVEEPAAPLVAEHATADRASDLKTIWRSAPGKVSAVALIIDMATGKAVFEQDPTKPVYPASVAKLWTTAAFVRSVDLDKKPATEVRASGKGGEVELAVIGVGDPSMTAADWAALAAAVKAAGVTKVKKLTVDASAFDDKLPKGFDEKQTDAAFRAPVGAVSVDASTVQVTVKPGAAGAPPIVVVTPDAGEAVEIINQAQTLAKVKRDSVGVSTRANGKKTEVVVQGTMGVKSRPIGSGRRRVADSVWFAAWVFRQQLDKQGIAVQGPPVLGHATPAGSVVARHVHHDWRAIVAVTNKQSHNGYAETLFKQVGLAQGAAPATAESSIEGVKKALSGLAIHWEGVRIGNGSGLYHANQVTARAVVDLLVAMAKDPKGKDWRATLAIGGVDGTLRGRLKDPLTKGKIFGKTGTLDDVSGLAGYAEGQGGKRYAFAFFFNDLKGGAGPYRAVQDRLLRRLLAD